MTDVEKSINFLAFDVFKNIWVSARSCLCINKDEKPWRFHLVPKFEAIFFLLIAAVIVKG